LHFLLFFNQQGDKEKTLNLLKKITKNKKNPFFIDLNHIVNVKLSFLNGTISE